MNKKLQKGIVAAIAATMGTGLVAPVYAAAAETTGLAAQYEAAYNATVNATTTKSQKDLTAARVLVDALYNVVKGTADEYLATTLSQILDPVQQTKLEALDTAIKAAEATPTQAKVNEARALLVDMPEVWAKAFSSYVDGIQDKVSVKVVDAIKKAQTSGLQADLDAAKVLYNELLTVTNNAGVKSWAETALKAELDKVVVELKVESVSTNNLKQLVVVFNKAVDKETAEDVTNYKLDNSALVEDSDVAELQADGKTVVITLNAAITTNASEHDFVVAKVEDAAGNKVTEFEGKFTAFDNIIPQATGVKLVGPTTVEVSFSEPIATIDGVTVLVDNGIYGSNVTDFKAGSNNKVVVVELGTTLTADKDYTLKVTGAEDFAGFAAPQKEFTLTYVKDTAAPTVSIKAATQETVTVKFSKAVKNLLTSSFYHTFATWTPISVTDVDGNAVVANRYYDEVKVNFTSTTEPTLNRALPEGTVQFTTLVGASGSEVQDLWGNKLAADVKLPVSITADRTVPTVTGIKATAEDKVEITFSEDVISAGNGSESNFVVTDKDGKAVTGFTAAYTTTNNVYKTTLTFGDDLAAGTYTVKVKNVADKSLYANKVTETTLSVTITDLTAPVSATGRVVGGNVVYVTFNEAMAVTGENSVLNKDNYRLDGAKLADDVQITAFDAKTVKLTGFAVNPTGAELIVRNVADTAGNKLDLFASINVGELAGDTAPVLTGVKTIALNKVEITVDQPLKSLNAAALKINGYTAAAATFVNNSDGTATITATLQAAAALATSNSVAVTVDVMTTGVVSLYGTSVVVANNVVDAEDITDGIAPTVKKVTFVDANTIEVQFTENLDAHTFAATGKNGFSVVGGTLTSANLQVVGTDGNTVVLRGSDFTNTTDVKYNSVVGLTDAASIKLADFSWTDTLSAVVAH